MHFFTIAVVALVLQTGTGVLAVPVPTKQEEDAAAAERALQAHLAAKKLINTPTPGTVGSAI